MARPAPTYDLVLLLDPQAEEPDRTKLLTDTKAAIAAKGELTRHDEWGERPLAYPIAAHATAVYHLLQFHAADTQLIGELTRTLHIADGVIRFRINKLGPGTPDAPDLKSERGGSGREEGERGRAEEHAAA